MGIPFVLLGDAPSQPTGMSRIATDLASRLWAEREALGIDLLHVGHVTWGPLPVAGVPIHMRVPWPCWVYQDVQDWGDTPMRHAIAHHFGPGVSGGVVLAVQDPGRSYSLLHPITQPDHWRRWGYFSVDGTNVNETIGGPAAYAVRTFDRVLGYGPYGAKVLQDIRASAAPDDPARAVPWLPHGIDRTVWTSAMTPEEHALAVRLLNPVGSDQQVIGCVATNQARKDLGLFVRVIAELRLRGHNVRGWLHTDEQVSPAWSVPQLTADVGLDWQSFTVTQRLTDRQLACCYALCTATLAPGRGEGFGYPILESLAVGTPVVHVEYGGGADLPVHPVAAETYHPTGPYGIRRPILNMVQVAAVLGAYLTATTTERVAPRLTAAYDWETLWPKWRAWVAEGLGHGQATDGQDGPREESTRG